MNEFLIELRAEAWSRRQHLHQHWGIQGLTLRQMDRYEKALAAYSRALQLDPDYAWAWGGKGETLRQMDRYEEALAAVGRSLELDPERDWSHYLRAMMCEKIGDVGGASSNLEQAIQLARKKAQREPSDRWGRFNLALYLLAAAQPEEALENYRQGVRDAHQFHVQEALRDLEDFAVWKGQVEGWDEAHALLQAALEGAGDSAELTQ
jgi:tetratricopeptide (TPR) repeat protein